MRVNGAQLNVFAVVVEGRTTGCIVMRAINGEIGMLMDLDTIDTLMDNLRDLHDHISVKAIHAINKKGDMP